MSSTPDSPAKMPDDRTTQGGNYWTLFTPRIWKLLHAVLHLHSDEEVRKTMRENGIDVATYERAAERMSRMEAGCATMVLIGSTAAQSGPFDRLATLGERG